MNLYNTKEAQAQHNEIETAWLGGGIHEDVIVKDISIDKTSLGSWYLKVTYIDKAGRIGYHTEYEPNRTPNATDEQFRQKVTNCINRIVNNFITPYFGYIDGVKADKEQLKSLNPQFEGSSFYEFISWVKETAIDKAKETKIRIKMIYREGSKYPDLGKFLSTAVEPMSTIKTKIVKGKNDLFEPVDIPTDAEPKTEMSSDPLARQAEVKVNNSIQQDIAGFEKKEAAELPF